jgi:hypothetical protein
VGVLAIRKRALWAEAPGGPAPGDSGNGGFGNGGFGSGGFGIGSCGALKLEACDWMPANRLTAPVRFARVAHGQGVALND